MIPENLPGNLVDKVHIYETDLKQFDLSECSRKSFFRTPHNNYVNIKKLECGSLGDIQSLKDLVSFSETYRRFKNDNMLGEKEYQSILDVLIDDSLKKENADEIFVACDSSKDDQIVAFTTLKLHEFVLNIEFLVVSSSYKGLGLEESLHSRAVMYGVEHLGWKNDITIRVSSEGVNVNLERMYENVECTMRTAMEIRHCWLPQDLKVESRVDNQPIPFCKQHMTGMELGCIQEVIDGGLDSASKFTFQCSSYIKDVLGKDCE